MKRKRIGIVLAILGALLALGIGGYVYYTAEQAAEMAKRTPTHDVVVALVELPERMPVPASAIAVVKVPADVVPAEAATTAETVVGKYPLTKIYKNSIVVTGQLADSAGKAGPAFTLKPGFVALTYPGSDLLTPTGAVRAGDKIDLLLSLPLVRGGTTTPTTGGGNSPAAQAAAQAATIPIVSQTLLQNVEVMRIGNFPAAGAGADAPAGKSVTFQVNHQDALILKWAKDSGGTIDMVLRHPSDREPVETEAITANYIYQKFKFRMSEPIQ